MSLSRRPALLLGGIAVAAVASVAVALYTQHQMGLQPCPWCVLQRLIALAVAAFALLGLAMHALRLIALRTLMAAGAALLSLSGAGAALWQQFVAAKSESCAMTLADQIVMATGLDARWPQVFAAYASCAEAQAKLLGVEYAFWSLALFIALAALALLAMASRRR